MSTYTMSEAGALLREPFDAALRVFINQSADTWSEFYATARKDMEINTRGRKLAIGIGRALGYGSFAEAGLLPTPVMMGDINAISYYKNHMLQGEVSGDFLDSPSETMLRAAVKRPMQMVLDTFKEYTNFFLFGTGSGALAVVTAYTSGTTFTSAPGTSSYGNRFLKVGMRISFVDATGATPRVNGGSTTYVATITSKNTTTGAVTCSGGLPSDLAATDLVLFADSAYGQEMQGFDYHIDNSTNTWLTVNKGTYPQANAVEYNFGGAMAANLIDNALLLAQNNYDKGSVRGNPPNDFRLISHAVQKKNYRALGYALTRVVDASGNPKIDLGFVDATHNGMRWDTDRACPPDVIYGIRFATWAIEATVLPQSYKYNRENMFAQKPGSGNYYDAFLFGTYWRGNVVCTQPNANWKGYGLTYTTAEVATNE